MNSNTIIGNWKELKGKVKQQWGELTDDDIAKMNGTREELEGKIQSAYGYEEERVKKEVDDFYNSNP